MTLLVASAVLVVFLLAAVVVRKGRPFTNGHVFRASRWSRSNHLFPTQVQIAPASIVHFTPRWIGTTEHSIHMAHVSSVRIHTSLLFSDVFIETSGGADPVRCHGHRKRDAIEMKRLIEQFQSAYYRDPHAVVPPVAPSAPSR